MLSDDQWSEIRLMAKSGKPIKQIARDFGISKNTVRKVIRTEIRRPYARTVNKSGVLDEFMPFLTARAPEVNFNATILFRELKEQQYMGGYSTVKNAVRPLRSAFQQAQAACIRFETPPGHQAQMDWGSAWVMLGTEKVRIRIFVLVLCYSRCIYVEFTLDEKLPTLISCHENAFDWFGGLTEEILYDNPRTIVLHRGTEEARLNPSFLDFCRYWGYRPRLCRPYRAQTKGKVESGVKYVKRSFLPGRTFSSLSDMNEQVQYWIRTVADVRIHGTVHEQPASRFTREELRPHQHRSGYVLEVCQMRKVASDCLVSYGSSRYSVPWKYIRQLVAIREQSGKIQIYHQDKLIAEHQKTSEKHKMVMHPDHYQGLSRPITAPGPKSLPLPEEVQVRSLSIYDRLAGGGFHG